MNRHESTAFLRSDEDDPDWLRDKPMGRCPWCDGALWLGLAKWHPQGYIQCSTRSCQGWDYTETELDNRARYQEERMAAAKIEERVNREIRGRDAPY